MITRKETGDRPSQMGDVVADEVGGGLVVLSSITPAGAGPRQPTASGGAEPSPYYQVLIKGERPTPKPGRADDFTWPRVDPESSSSRPRPRDDRRAASSPKAGSPRS